MGFYSYLLNHLSPPPHCFRVLSGPLRFKKICLAPRHGLKKILGNYEREVVSTLLSLISPGDACFDIGCHIGYLSLAMRAKTGKQGMIYAIDPLPSSCQLVKKSFRKNGWENIKTFAVGVGDKEETLSARIFTDSDMANFADSAFSPAVTAEGENRFRITTIDKIASQEKISGMDVIKLDVEGYELKVLRGAKKSIRKFSPKILIEAHTKKLGQQVSEFLQREGYKIFDLNGKPVETEQLEQWRFPNHLVAIAEKRQRR